MSSDQRTESEAEDVGGIRDLPNVQRGGNETEHEPKQEIDENANCDNFLKLSVPTPGGPKESKVAIDNSGSTDPSFTRQQ